MKQTLLFVILLGLTNVTFAATVMAPDRISDIRNTKHNFSTSDIVTLPGGGERDVKAVDESQVCIFCHTPHGDPALNEGDRQFLWNRPTSGANYTRYDSSSTDHTKGGLLGEGSKMCLSCHDGTVAIGQLDVINSQLRSLGRADVEMIGANVNAGLLTGIKSNLGTDLTNDHPIGFNYNSALATADGELIDPTSSEGDHIGIPIGQSIVQHNINAETASGSTASSSQPKSMLTGISIPLETSTTLFNQNRGAAEFIDILGGSVECTTCHDPHIRSTDNSVNIKFLRLRRFQTTTGPTAGSFSRENDINCLACHKKTGWENSVHADVDTATHSYVNAEADAREFPRGTQMWQASCLNCHAPHTVNNARWLLTQGEDTTFGSEASDVDRSCYKCHTSAGASVVETVDNVGAAIIDATALTGGHAGFTFTAGDTAHRPGSDTTVDFLAESSENLQVRHVGCSDCHSPHGMTKGLHLNENGTHTNTLGAAQNNNVSGVLSGVAGLNALDSSGTFDPYGNEDTAEPVIATKEHQICLKCHSTYGHRADNIAPANFSNTVMEFSNTTSAHPVMTGTGNVGLSSDLVVAPFNSDIGVQTMYCSDCHTNTDDSGSPVSPFGSHNNGVAACETCHVAEQYNFTTANVVNSGFACQSAIGCATGANFNNLHVFHGDQGTVCSNCHVKVSHGWKNKALLANINDADSADTRYYGTVSDSVGAKSKIDTMSPSGQWTKASCGTAGGCH